VSRRFALGLLGLLFVIPFHCRKAESAAVDPLDRAAEDAFVAYLRIDTTNPPGNETRGAVFLRDLLKREGIDARLVGADPQRQALYAKLDSPASDGALLLLSHIDVVPAEASAWRHPPFGGVRDGGYIWGRGALDIKSLTIAQAMSLIELKRRGAKLKRDVVLLAVPDEELGSKNGCEQLLEKHPELFEGVSFVLNEGGANETAVDRVLFWGIEVQQKVPLWLRVTTEGHGGHGASPPEDGGASAKLVRALAKIESIERPYRLEPSVARIAALRNDERGRKLQRVRDPIDIGYVERELTPHTRNLLRDTIAVTRISAPGAVNVIPARAFAEIDVRLLPDTAPDAMLQRVRDAAGPEAKVEVLIAGKPSPASPLSGELFDALSRVMLAHSPGASVAPVVISGTTDSRHFRARGIAAYGISPFKVNYYDVEGIHGLDERIRAQFFVEGVRVMRQIVREFCESK
jgi:acetylornithine deacetylase/succinyl-diaminopimelate desuccinylase-like protein